MPADEPEEQLDPLAPQDEARLRALLADARETGPMPAAVASRLDDALAGLAADRSSVDPEPADNVVHLHRTRRHRVGAVLGVAAAVAVLGLGIGTFFDNTGDAGSDSTSAGSIPERGDNKVAAEDGAAERAPTADDADAGLEDGELGTTSYEVGLLTIRSRHLAEDLARLQRAVLEQPESVDYADSLSVLPDGFSCRDAHYGPGVLVGVQYDGAPALVAFREPMGASQVVEVLQCGTGDVLRSTTLPTGG